MTAAIIIMAHDRERRDQDGAEEPSEHGSEPQAAGEILEPRLAEHEKQRHRRGAAQQWPLARQSPRHSFERWLFCHAGVDTPAHTDGRRQYRLATGVRPMP
jgi:hypothetical protein